MTRKRVVKLLMAHGFSRDEAIQKTDLSKSRYGSYSELYQSMKVLLLLKPLGIAMRKIGKSVKKVSMTFQAFSEHCRNGLVIAPGAFEPKER